VSTDEIAPAREHTDQFRLLVESVVDYAIFLLDPAGYVRSWNMGAERIKGYTADEIIGKHFSVFYPPDDRERGVPQSVLGIARDEGRFEGEGWRIRKDGARFWANVVITALHDDTGELVGFAKVTRDLTERKSADEQRLSLVQAEQAARSAEEAVAVRDEFVRIAAHELNTPLTGAKIGLQLLQRSLRDGELTPSQTLALDTLGTQINKLIHLVGELLDATRMEAGALRLEPTEVDLAELVRRLAEQWRALTQEHEIVVESAIRDQATVLVEGIRLAALAEAPEGHDSAEFQLGTNSQGEHPNDLKALISNRRCDKHRGYTGPRPACVVLHRHDAAERR